MTQCCRSAEPVVMQAASLTAPSSMLVTEAKAYEDADLTLDNHDAQSTKW